MKMSLNQWLKAVALAGPIILFPFSRGYYIFYVAILAFALTQIRLPVLWKSWPEMRHAFYAVALPIVFTTLCWLVFKGGAHWKWVGTFFGLASLATMLGLATAALAQDERIKFAAQALISAAVISWVIDGCVQLLLGVDISCRTSGTDCANAHHVSLYFSGQTKLGYYIGMMALLPAYWLLEQQQKWLALAVLMAAGAVVMAGGSRFGMLAFLLGGFATVLTLTLSLSRLFRAAILVIMPITMVLLAVVFYYSNHAFHDRIAVSAMAFNGFDYQAVNTALSQRLDIWFPAASLIRDHWFVGIGPGELSDAIRPYLSAGNIFLLNNIKIFHAHQVVLEIWIATGLIGLLAFLVYYFRVTLAYARATMTGINMGVAALLIFILMWFPLSTPHGFYSSELMLLTFYMLGLGFGWSRRPVGNQVSSDA